MWRVAATLGTASLAGGSHPFQSQCPEYTRLTTQIFIAGEPRLDSDTTFAMRSVIVQLQKHEAPDELKVHNQSKPFFTTEFDFVLKPVTKSERL